MRVDALVETKDQMAHKTDIQVMCARCRAVTVFLEDGSFNEQRVGGAALAEDTVLIIVQVTVANGQITAFIADAGSILISHGRAGEFQTVDSNGRAVDNHEAL